MKALYYIFSVGFLALVVSGLIVMALRGGRFSLKTESAVAYHFPMQNVLKIKFSMSSVVVAPVTASSGRRAL